MAVEVAVEGQREEEEREWGVVGRRGFSRREVRREERFARRQPQPTSTTATGCLMEKRRRREDIAGDWKGEWGEGGVLYWKEDGLKEFILDRTEVLGVVIEY